MPPRRTRPTLKDLATRLGISESAASFALNNRPGVSEETRRRVLALAKELQWAPHHAARNLAGITSMTVGFVLTRDVQEFGMESFYLRLLTGAQSVLSDRGYGLLFQMTRSVDEELAVLRRWSEERRVEGVIISDLRRGDPRPAFLAELGLPAVLAGGPDPKKLLPCVMVDDAEAMRLIVDHLHQTGHRRLAYVSGPGDLLHVHRRIAAFKQAAAGSLATPGVVGTDYSDEQGVAATRQLIDASERPDAVVFDNEVLAVAGVRALRSAGLSVPADVSVVSCEDSAICMALQPSLTAVQRDPTVFGEAVARKLLRLVHDEPEPAVEAQQPTIVIRESTRQR
ncbi:LacI family DNA-binding transcriptional regulator [Actinoplanes couchii]|uniref:LacI family transcriptional regulator n=1 Tax=Actinoplanes couchii TaxID=403638 RepID=A0ABQ3XE43_9ACTN|nr:LacI family DNA-binding transcriptional regulator [Actinoplanes couchii]MDR6317265.1 DNA-binding LacI/PurR family transcriptional regulator [Actinoplanes couchii]GID56759.1 LacI family transcriptional regulator [Actinoplanes couchii]